MRTHFGAYWKFFDSKTEERRVTNWRVRLHSPLADAAKNDIIWLFTSGEKCKRKLPVAELTLGGVQNSLGYLVEVFTALTVVRDEVGQFTWNVEGIHEKCFEITPPLLVDDIVRPDGWGRDKAIGALRQGSWVLPDLLVDMLERRLRAQRPELHQRLFG